MKTSKLPGFRHHFQNSSVFLNSEMSVSKSWCGFVNLLGWLHLHVSNRYLLCVFFMFNLLFCFSLYFLFSIGLAVRIPDVYSVTPIPSLATLFIKHCQCELLRMQEWSQCGFCSGGAPSSLMCEVGDSNTRPVCLIALLVDLLKA